jgi:hypothetical protein
LKTTTVVGTGEVNFVRVNSRVKTSRNCSNRVPTWRISFSLALPIRKKFFDLTLTQLSLAETVVWLGRNVNKQRVIAKKTANRFILLIPCGLRITGNAQTFEEGPPKSLR